MGQVVKAWNVRLGKFVAVKMLHVNHLSKNKVMERFRHEMAAASRLDHPHIVQVSDAGEAGDIPYMVMEYCEGTKLSALVKAKGALPIHLACDYLRQAALGLQHAFQQGVVHRDVKPGNMLLVKGPPEMVKIVDFGLARLQATTGSRLTMVGTIIGTIDYVAPEQVENAQKADVRSDIYSLGATLFYLLTARPPFAGNSMVEKVTGRLMGEVPKLVAARPDVSPELDAVFQRMMATKPDDRYQTPAEVAKALVPFSASPPTAIPVARPAPGRVCARAESAASGPLGVTPMGVIPADAIPTARPILAASVPAVEEPAPWLTAAAQQTVASPLPNNSSASPQEEENPFAFSGTVETSDAGVQFLHRPCSPVLRLHPRVDTGRCPCSARRGCYGAGSRQDFPVRAVSGQDQKTADPCACWWGGGANPAVDSLRRPGDEPPTGQDGGLSRRRSAWCRR